MFLLSKTIKSNYFIIDKKNYLIIIYQNLLKFFLQKIRNYYVINNEKNFFSKDYHREIFFYVYSDLSKKVLAQGGGYKYKKNNKVFNGFGFSCNIDNWVELI